mmetsp:Transcript_39169/g.110908  ORF Transcript_39169/g.110908 Transcript_39169/m.110908 type:complete len:248 (-) Transcript_39169:1075-1818(-)
MWRSQGAAQAHVPRHGLNKHIITGHGRACKSLHQRTHSGPGIAVQFRQVTLHELEPELGVPHPDHVLPVGIVVDAEGTRPEAQCLIHISLWGAGRLATRPAKQLLQGPAVGAGLSAGRQDLPDFCDKPVCQVLHLGGKGTQGLGLWSPFRDRCVRVEHRPGHAVSVLLPALGDFEALLSLNLNPEPPVGERLALNYLDLAGIVKQSATGWIDCTHPKAAVAFHTPADHQAIPWLKDVEAHVLMGKNA